jgi:hypothetical protein
MNYAGYASDYACNTRRYVRYAVTRSRTGECVGVCARACVCARMCEAASATGVTQVTTRT